MARSQDANPNLFEKIVADLGASMPSRIKEEGKEDRVGSITIRRLDVEPNYKTGGAIPDLGVALEYALRLRIGDKRGRVGGAFDPNSEVLARRLKQDIVYSDQEIEIEVATARGLHANLKKDSRGLTSSPLKWYLYVDGPVELAQKDYQAWLMRGDQLQRTYQEVMIDKEVRDASIDPGSPDAIKQIEGEIHRIAGWLARQVLRKAGGKSDEETGQSTLHRLVGPNSVRFSVVFGPARRSAARGEPAAQLELPMDRATRTEARHLLRGLIDEILAG